MAMPRSVFTAVNLVGIIVFAVFAWLQREDDNPVIYESPSTIDVWVWIIFYGLIAVAFGLAIAGKFPIPLYAVAVLFCAYQLVTTGPGLWANLTGDQGFEMTKTSMSPERAHVEQSREFFGSIIALAAIGFLWWQRSAMAGSRSDVARESS